MVPCVVGTGGDAWSQKLGARDRDSAICDFDVGCFRLVLAADRRAVRGRLDPWLFAPWRVRSNCLDLSFARCGGGGISIDLCVSAPV